MRGDSATLSIRDIKSCVVEQRDFAVLLNKIKLLNIFNASTGDLKILKPVTYHLIGPNSILLWPQFIHFFRETVPLSGFGQMFPFTKT